MDYRYAFPLVLGFHKINYPRQSVLDSAFLVIKGTDLPDVRIYLGVVK